MAKPETPKKAVVKSRLNDKQRHDRFIETAQSIGASESPEDFDRAFDRVAKPRDTSWDGENYRQSCFDHSLALERELRTLRTKPGYEDIHDNNSALQFLLRYIGDCRACHSKEQVYDLVNGLSDSNRCPPFVNSKSFFKEALNSYILQIKEGDLNLVSM